MSTENAVIIPTVKDSIGFSQVGKSFSLMREHLEKSYQKKYGDQKKDLEALLLSYTKGEIEHESFVSSKSTLYEMGLKLYLFLYSRTELVVNYLESYNKNRYDDKESIRKHNNFISSLGDSLNKLKHELDDDSLRYKIIRLCPISKAIFIAIPCMVQSQYGHYSERFALGRHIYKSEYPYTYNYCIEKMTLYTR